MVCACSRLEFAGRVGEISEELRAKLNCDSIMLRVNKGEADDDNLSLTSLVFNYFIKNVMGVSGLSRQKLFGTKFLGHLIKTLDEYPISPGSEPQNEALLHYNYTFSAIPIHELILRLLIDNPELI